MFSVGELFNRLSGFLGRVLGIAGNPSGGTHAVGMTSRHAINATGDAQIIRPMVPAVAGYEKRLDPINLMLPARLASVAKLNTRAGRKPIGSNAVQHGAPQIPVVRVGAKKQRATATGPRVLRPSAPRLSAQIIAFPVGDDLAAAKAALQALAA